MTDAPTAYVLELPMFVYIAERDGQLKIGCSGNPRGRAVGLHATLLGCHPGSFWHERQLLRQFAEHRLPDRGREWFEDVPAIRALANEWGTDCAPPPPAWAKRLRRAA